MGANLYSEWRDFYIKRVSSWMSLEELRAECGKLQTVDNPSPEVLLVHAMHALEECVQRDEALLRQAGAVPLTDEQIRAMAREHPAEDLCGWSYRMGVADAERHHGIKGG